MRVKRYLKNFSLINLSLCLLLSVISYTFYYINFTQIETFNRDLLQLANFNNKIDQRIATLSINVTEKFLSTPLKYKDLELIINKIKAQQPNKIIFILEPNDITDLPDELKKIKKLFEKNKIWLNALVKGRDDFKHFAELPEFSTYKYFFYFGLCFDQDRNFSTRRMIIEFYNIKQDLLSDSMGKIGAIPKDKKYFSFSFDHLDTKQIYTKSLTKNEFDTYLAEDLLIDSIPPLSLKDKFVFVGRTDEYSWLTANNIFNTIGLNKQQHSTKIRFYPASHLVASNFNTLLTGDYIKLYRNKNFHVSITILLIVLVLVSISPIKKLYIFLLLFPLLITLQLVTYLSTSIYIDLSSTYVFLLALQYLLLPVFAFKIINEQRIQHYEELNNSRIDALLEISEKVAHDIRSPLSAINLIISKASFKNEEQKNVVTGSLSRIEQISTELLNKYKYNIQENKQFINLADIIAEVLQEKKILQPNINYRTDLLVDKDTLVQANRIELIRVISNLVDNSIQALSNQKTPSIDIKIIKQPNSAKLIIEDNGTGITESALKIIGSKRFTTKDHRSGNGIGILHAKRYIEQIGGNLEINSTEGKYTRVIITLPIAKK